jgi:hypothetical protein
MIYKVLFDRALGIAVSRFVSPGVKLHLGPKIKFLLLWDICCFVDLARPLLREDESVICRGNLFRLFWQTSDETKQLRL